MTACINVHNKTTKGERRPGGQKDSRSGRKNKREEWVEKEGKDEGKNGGGKKEEEASKKRME